MAHGLGADPFNYFDPGPKCKQCYGMPEYRAIVLEALRREYAVISVKSIGDMYDIFDSPIEASEDLVHVTTIIKEWSWEHSLETLPWPHEAFRLAPLWHQLSPRSSRCEAWSSWSVKNFWRSKRWPLPALIPPTMFAYMPNNKSDPKLNITGKDAEAMAELTEQGVRVAETQMWPQPLHPLFFTERILCMSDEMSRNIFAALEAAGWLDGRGFLTIDPISTAYTTSMLLNAKVLPFCTAAGELCLLWPVLQELRMAYGVHGISSDANEAIFAWLDSTVQSSSCGGARVQFQ